MVCPSVAQKTQQDQSDLVSDSCATVGEHVLHTPVPDGYKSGYVGGGGGGPMLVGPSSFFSKKKNPAMWREVGAGRN